MQLSAIMAVGLFGCWRVQFCADSASYLKTSKLALEPALRQSRTLGYPMILRLVATFSPDYEALPWVQLAMLWPAVFFFDAAVRRFGASPWQAFAVSSGFMYGPLQLYELAASVLTDFPAMLAAGMAVACLFWIAARPRSWGAWLGLALFVAACYQIRPAYLFMIPLTPCLGLIFRYLRTRTVGEPFVWKSLLAGLVGVAVAPFLAFCTLRLVLVGDFALVSGIGGSNALGLAAELLDRDMIDQLPEHYRPFALEIRRGREEQHLQPAFRGWYVDMRAYEDNYSKNIYLIAKPAAERFFGEDPIVRNRQVTGFARTVVGLQKGKFLLWSVQYWPRAVMKLAYRYWIVWAAIPLTLLLFLIRRLRYGSCRQITSGRAEARSHAPLLPALLCLNVLYFAAATAVLIVSGTYADSRVIVPAGVFLPSLFGLLILQESSLLAAARPSASRA